MIKLRQLHEAMLFASRGSEITLVCERDVHKDYIISTLSSQYRMNISIESTSLGKPVYSIDGCEVAIVSIETYDKLGYTSIPNGFFIESILDDYQDGDILPQRHKAIPKPKTLARIKPPGI